MDQLYFFPIHRPLHVYLHSCRACSCEAALPDRSCYSPFGHHARRSHGRSLNRRPDRRRIFLRDPSGKTGPIHPNAFYRNPLRGRDHLLLFFQGKDVPNRGTAPGRADPEPHPGKEDTGNTAKASPGPDRTPFSLQHPFECLKPSRNFDPVRGKAMLGDLTRYLRSSLSRTRDQVTTLGQEMDLIQAYLEIQRVRMGDRLCYAIEVPEALRNIPVPPMLVQPLVENALIHGLEPRIEGGRDPRQGRGHRRRLSSCCGGHGLGDVQDDVHCRRRPFQCEGTAGGPLSW